MKKNAMMILAVVLVFRFAAITAATAAPIAPRAGFRLGPGGYGLMWDTDGNFISKDAFEANLDRMIDDGLLRAEDRESYLERYNFCATQGCGSIGARGSFRGRELSRGPGRGLGSRPGRGFGRGW